MATDCMPEPASAAVAAIVAVARMRAPGLVTATPVGARLSTIRAVCTVEPSVLSASSIATERNSYEPSATPVEAQLQENGAAASVQAVLHVLAPVARYSKRIEVTPEPASVPVPDSV